MDQISDILPLTDLEQQLLQALPQPGYITGPKQKRGKIRASLIRCILMQKDPSVAVDPSGLKLSGFEIDGDLDLGGCKITLPIRLDQCLIHSFSCFNARLAMVSLSGCSLTDFTADNCIFDGHLFLRKGFYAADEVRLMGSQINGDFDATDGHFMAQGHALSMDGARVGGMVFLRNGFRAAGKITMDSIEVGKHIDLCGAIIDISGDLAINLHNSRIKGDLVSDHTIINAQNGKSLSLAGAKISGSLIFGEDFHSTGTLEMIGTRVGGDLSLAGGEFTAGQTAICAQRAVVDGCLIISPHTKFNGALDVSEMKVGSLSDVADIWPAESRLDGFEYGALAGLAPRDASARITMLSQQYQDDLTGDDFKHQPWDQTIKILAASGYVRQAEDIAIAKENALWAGGVRNMPSFLHYLWGYCVGFGYRPLRLLWALPIIWLLSIPLYLAAANANLMAPTDDKILSDPAFDMCKPAHGGNWTACALAPNYPDFQVMGYALSLLIPAIDTRLGHSWAPSDWSMTLPRRPSALGLAAIIWSWIEGIFALAAPALIAGVFTGITKRSLPGQAR